jgi:hypothetical protein
VDTQIKLPLFTLSFYPNILTDFWILEARILLFSSIIETGFKHLWALKERVKNEKRICLC